MKKEIITTIIILVVLVLTIVGLGKVIKSMDEKSYQDAIARCKSEDNIQTKYTSQGDKYFTCKVNPR